MLLSRLFARNALRDIQQITQHSTASRLCNASHTVSNPASRPSGAVLSWRGYATDVVEDVDADTTLVIKKRTKSPRTTNNATPGRRPGRPKKSETAGEPSLDKPKKTRTPKKVETEEEKMKNKVALHKRHALLDQPKGLPTTAWLVYISQSKKPVKDMRTTADAFKDLSFSDKEHLTSVGLANAAANSEAFKTWVEAHTEEELRQANNARRALRKIAKLPLPEGRKQRFVDAGARVYSQIPIKATAEKTAARNNAWMMYFRENYHNEEYAGMLAPKRSSALSKLFKELTPEEKKVYLERGRAAALGEVTADI